MKGRTSSVGGLVTAALALFTVPASAQDRPAAAPDRPQARFSLEAAAGPQVYYTGHEFSLAFGFAPTPSLTLLVTAHRSYTEDEIDFYPDGFAAERGDTERFVAAEMRYHFLPRKRVAPYVPVGGGLGTSQPNANQLFLHKRERDIGVFFYGGGVRIPVRPWLDAFADARLIMAAEAKSDFFAVRYPVRAGVAWRF